jgi:hypothetical protein
MSTPKEAVSNELDSKFVVSEYVSSNPPVPSPLLIAIQAMTIPQRFQVEQSMNEIVAKWSEKDQKAYLERCKVLESGWTQTVTFSERKEGRTVKTWTFNHVNMATRALLEWVQRFSLARIMPTPHKTRMDTFNDDFFESSQGIKFYLTLKHPSLTERIRLDPTFTSGGGWAHFGGQDSAICYRGIIRILNRPFTTPYTLTQEETDLVLGERLNTSKFTMRECLEFIANENRVWVEDHWLYINVSKVCTRIE